MARSAADPDTRTIPPEGGITYGSTTILSDPWAFRLLWLAYVILLIGSWGRWTQPIVDHGREMNVPARIAAGEVLYQDVQYLYGPLAPQLNALLFSVFGVRLGVLHVAGVICAALILFLIFHIARQVMDPLESLVTTSLVLVLCAVKSTANYISPYSYGALYGVALALISLWFALKYWREGGGRAPSMGGDFCRHRSHHEVGDRAGSRCSRSSGAIAFEPVVAPASLDGVASLSAASSCASLSSLSDPRDARVAEDAD